VEITPGLAAAGAAFVLLDPYQVDIEHYVLAEALFQLLVTVAAFLLLWRARPQTWVVGVAGVLLAMATLARFAGALLGVAAIVYLIMRRQGLRAVAALVVGLLLPVAVYSVWFSSSSGSVGITNKEGYFLYGRVFTFADCDRVDVAQDLEKYCPTQPLNTRESGGFFSIREGLSGGESSETNRDLSAFARAVISQQPLDYVSAVASDFLRFFDISQPKDRERHARRWLFVESVEEVDPHPLVERLRGSPPPELGSEQEFQIDRGLAGALRTYQSVVYVYGPLLAVWLLLGVAGALWGRDPRARSATVLFSLGSLLLLWFPVMVTVYHFRYVIAALPTSGAAGAAGVRLLRARWRHRRSASTATALARERSSEVRQKSTNDIP
jgi:4-amino-4-deoxy-L-arabinose transferase-like glycosyltransferase